MANVKFAVLGCGHIGKRHAEMIMQDPSAELTAMADILPADDLGLEKFSAHFYSSADALLKHADADVINICTPNGLHATHAILALEHGKHVVIEKPMALSKSDCENIIAAGKKNGKKIFCVMQNRFSPPAQWIQKIIAENILGRIFMVQVNCFWNRDERYYTGTTWHGKAALDGGTLFTQFSHFIDTMIWLFGDIENIQAQFADYNHTKLTDFEDAGNIIFRFRQGGMGSIHYSTSVYDKNFESSLRIIAENGTVLIGGQYMNTVEYCDIKHYSMPELPPTNAPNQYGPYTGSAANHQYIIRNVIEVLQQGAEIATTAEEGMLVVDVIERIYALRPSSLLHK